jgi:adenylate cyclase
MLFVDVRGSTSLAEQMSAAEFSRLMSRFYKVATDVLVKADAFIDKFVGDEVIGLFLPAFAGSQPARQAVEAARRLLEVTGHGDPGGPWLPVGVGVHTGTAFFGTVQGVEDPFSDFTALGDNVNVAARLASEAGPGEALISDAALAAADLDLGASEHRKLDLKGRNEPVGVHVLHLA